VKGDINPYFRVVLWLVTGLFVALSASRPTPEPEPSGLDYTPFLNKLTVIEGTFAGESRGRMSTRYGVQDSKTQKLYTCSFMDECPIRDMRDIVSRPRVPARAWVDGSGAVYQLEVDGRIVASVESVLTARARQWDIRRYILNPGGLAVLALIIFELYIFRRKKRLTR
jgi:hypothetical protein